jgi:hypothetical protein
VITGNERAEGALCVFRCYGAAVLFAVTQVEAPAVTGHTGVVARF